MLLAYYYNFEWILWNSQEHNSLLIKTWLFQAVRTMSLLAREITHHHEKECRAVIRATHRHRGGYPRQPVISSHQSSLVTSVIKIKSLETRTLNSPPQWKWKQMISSQVWIFSVKMICQTSLSRCQSSSGRWRSQGAGAWGCLAWCPGLCSRPLVSASRPLSLPRPGPALTWGSGPGSRVQSPSTRPLPLTPPYLSSNCHYEVIKHLNFPFWGPKNDFPSLLRLNITILWSRNVFLCKWKW